LRLALCESSRFFSSTVKYPIEYSSIRLIPEIAINYTVVQSKQTRASSFEFVVKHGLKQVQIMPEMLIKYLVKRGCNL